MRKQLIVDIGQHTSPGRKQLNQDFHGACTPRAPLRSSKGIAVAIADGISSSDVSQVASETAVSGFLSDYYCTPETWSVKTSALRVLQATNSWLYSQTRNSPHRFNKDKGYICTFSAIVFKSTTAHIFHSGDARIYRLNDNSLEQLTEDHRRQESAETSYLTRALGIHQNLDMDFMALPLKEGDVFVLSTDGVYEFVSDTAMVQTIQSHDENLDLAAESLLNQAFEAGSEDNLTLQIIRIRQLPDQKVHEVHQQVSSLPLPPRLQPRMQFDGYDIRREIYISSRSHVFLAVDTETGQEVVIKTPSTEQSENQDYLESFLMEEWIARRISNAHVARVIEPRRKRSYLYMAVEYIEGQTLSQWMTDNPAPDIESVRTIIEQIAKGLQALHRQEMIHQDLRPNNIMIDRSGTVKIIDFGATAVAGVSEIIGRDLSIQGTAQYTAPEYFLGEGGSSRSDIFSLGVIAYQMLSGTLPYGTGISQARSSSAQRKLIYKSVLSDDQEIPAWLDETLKKTVHIQPLKRYSEVSEFAYELRHPNKKFLNKARPPLVERNPVLVWQGVSLILLFIIILQAV